MPPENLLDAAARNFFINVLSGPLAEQPVDVSEHAAAAGGRAGGSGPGHAARAERSLRHVPAPPLPSFLGTGHLPCSPTTAPHPPGPPTRLPTHPPQGVPLKPTQLTPAARNLGWRRMALQILYIVPGDLRDPKK